MQRWWLVVGLAGCDQVFGLEPRAADAPTAPDAAPDVIAQYRFESLDPRITDDAGGHHGTVIGSLSSTAGVMGNAVEFPPMTPTPHILVPDSSAWDLPVGSIELWVRPIDSTGTIGILSRDNTGTSDGHLSLFQSGRDRFVVRLQRSTDAAGGGGMALCSDDAPIADQWTHIGINLGAPQAELWVDGVRGTSTTIVPVFGANLQCTTDEARSIIGNDDPWVIGALSVASSLGTTDRVEYPLAGGAIDELVIRRVRSDFLPR